MKVRIVRGKDGKVSKELCIARYIKDQQEAATEKYKKFLVALDAKLAGGHDGDDVIADGVKEFWKRYSAHTDAAKAAGKEVKVSVSKNIVVQFVTSYLFEKGAFNAITQSKEANEAVLGFLLDNSGPEGSDAWFHITDGRGRGAGQVKINNPAAGDELGTVSEDEVSQDAETPENAETPANEEVTEQDLLGV